VAGAGGCSFFFGLRAATGALATAHQALMDWNCTGPFSGTLHAQSSGDANATELATIASDCGSNDVFVNMYEQISGTNKTTKQGNGERFFNGVNCNQLARCWLGGFTAGSNLYSVSTTVAQPWSIAIVACGTSQGYGDVMAKSGAWDVGFTGANTTGMFAGSQVTATASDCGYATTPNNAHSIQDIANGSSSIIVVDGTATTGLNPGTTGISNNFGLGADNTNSSINSGPMSEYAAYPIALAAGSGAGQYGKVCNNQRVYWGTLGSC